MATASDSSIEIPAEDHDICEQLAKLQNMHTQISDLRSLLPDKLVTPTQAIAHRSGAASPHKVAANLKDAAITGSKDIKIFKLNYQSEEMKALWQRVNSSEFPQGADVWSRDYSRPASNSTIQQHKSISQEEAKTDTAAKNEEVELLEKYQSLRPKFAATSNMNGHALPLELTIDGTTLFVESAGPTASKEVRVRLRNEYGASSTWRDILRYIEQERASDTLESILSLLSSYQSFKTMTCQKCSKIFGRDLELALIRKPKAGTSNHASQIWIALHESCVS